MKLELVILLVVCLPVIVDGIISIHANHLRYLMGMKKLESPPEEEEEEGPVGFQ